MTKDEIIRMASDAGFDQEDDDIFICGIEHINKLLEMEREACAKAAENVVPRHTECGNKIAAAIRARGKK